MRKTLLTTALILPLGLGTAWAQGTTPETAPAAPPAATTPVAPPETSPETTPETAPVTPAPEAAHPEAAHPEAAAGAAVSPLEVEMASSDKVARQQAENELRIDWITGTNVMSPDGQAVGRINDLIVDGGTGQMIAAIIGVGGFLGVGEKQIAVPWDQLTVNYDASQITTDLTREEADAAPPYAFREREQPPAPEN